MPNYNFVKDRHKVLLGNVERNYFIKQPWERKDFTVDFTESLGSAGSVSGYIVNATDDSGVSLDTTILAGYSESTGVITVGVKNGSSGHIYTLTSRVTSDQVAPSGVSLCYEADIFMRVANQT